MPLTVAVVGFTGLLKIKTRIAASSEQAIIDTFEFTFKIKQSTYLEIFGYARKIVVILEGSEDGVSFGTEIGDGKSRQKCDPMSHD